MSPGRAATTDPLPYDPFAVAKVFSAFSLGLWSDPTRLMEAQARGLNLMVGVGHGEIDTKAGRRQMKPLRG